MVLFSNKYILYQILNPKHIMEISFRPSDYNHIKCNINKYNSFIAIIYLAFHSHLARSSLVFNEQNNE